MRKWVSAILLGFVAAGFFVALSDIPFGVNRMDVAEHYIDKGVAETGAVNIVTSVVVNYRALDTLGEVTVLFVASLGLGALLYAGKDGSGNKQRASLIVRTGSRILFPLILLFGAYIFVHGHLTPGGGFQGGAVIASAFLLQYLAYRSYRIDRQKFSVVESISGSVFVVVGLLGLAIGGYFLSNFLGKGVPYSLFSAGVIPVLYVAIGLKVGAELAGIVAGLMESGRG
jgi:multicomponent Na+:H+ antiporter subunit B